MSEHCGVTFRTEPDYIDGYVIASWHVRASWKRHYHSINGRPLCLKAPVDEYIHVGMGVHEARRSVDVQLHNPELTSSFHQLLGAWCLVIILLIC